MTEYHLKLPWPPSLNTYWRHARHRHYISEKGKAYRQSIIQIIQQQNLDINTPARLKISIIAHAPDKRLRDLDNLQKAVFDSLMHAGFMLDVACQLALEYGKPSAAVILNELRRLVEPAREPSIEIPDSLRLLTEPQADCSRYNSLLEVSHV